MNVKEAIRLLESAINKKVISYARLDKDIYLFVTESDLRLMQNNLYIVDSNGKIEITIPELVDFYNLDLINI